MVTIKDFEIITRRLIQSKSLTQVLQDCQISPIEFFKYLNDNPAQKTEFELARQISLERALDESVQAIDACDTELDIKRISLKLRTNQWLCEKLIPQVYGAQVNINVHKTIDIRGVLEDARKRVFIESDVIEVKGIETAKPEGESYSDILG